MRFPGSRAFSAPKTSESTVPVIVPRARRLTRELKAQIDAHQIWLRTNGAAGTRLVLKSAALHNLSRLCLRRINARGGHLYLCNLDGADLSGSDLSHADLGLASCRRTNFAEATMRNAVLTGTNLEGAILVDTVLDGCWAPGTNFSEATFARTSLLGATLDPERTRRDLTPYLARLHAAALHWFNRSLVTRISQAQVDQCVCDRRTILPQGLRRKLRNRSDRATSRSTRSRAKTRAPG